MLVPKVFYIAYEYYPGYYILAKKKEDKDLVYQWAFKTRKVRDAFAELYGLHKTFTIIHVDVEPKKK